MTFFHCVTTEMSNVFSESDLAILSHIQKTAQGKSCACFIEKRVIWEDVKAADTELHVQCVLSALCPFGFSLITFSLPSPSLTGTPSPFCQCGFGYLSMARWLLHSPGNIPLTSVARTSSQLPGEGACGDAGLASPPVLCFWVLSRPLWEGVKLWGHSPKLNTGLALVTDLIGYRQMLLTPPLKLVKVV